MTEARTIWEDYWMQGGRGPESGCLPNALAEIDSVQRQAWNDFGSSLPPKAKVLDLGTGDGAVLGKLRSHRKDLRLLGVDSSRSLPPAPAGTSTRAAVAMERLPFPRESFDAVVSQFGIEYSDLRGAIVEAARVLRGSGSFQFIVHHREGRILAHNLERLDGLVWASRESLLLSKARNLARARLIASLPTPPTFAEAVEEGKRRFPRQGVAEEFTTALKQTLDRGRLDPKGTMSALDDLERLARNEIGRIEALRAAARSRVEIGELIEDLRRAGLDADDPNELLEPRQRQPFAWKLRGRKIG